MIPELRKHRFINVWDAGCAMGPEPYSIAIIFKETLGYYEFKRLQIYATDLDEESNQFGNILRAGIYPEETVKRIPKEIFNKHFSPNNKPGHFKISDEIMNRVSFQKHDLRSLEPIRTIYPGHGDPITEDVKKLIYLSLDNVRKSKIIQ